MREEKVMNDKGAGFENRPRFEISVEDSREHRAAGSQMINRGTHSLSQPASQPVIQRLSFSNY